MTLAPAGVLRRASTITFDPAVIAEPESIEFPTTGDRTAHALYYPPTNPDFRGPEGEKPPLIVLSHGGPTSNASTALDLNKQFMTSRGIAVVDVDYGGSTGYGREYRQRLDGQWGVVDVDDCVAAARYLVERGDVDPDRLAIEGGSAGGYTTLAALAFRDVFAAGISLFGIGDLELLDTDSHKFESHYNRRLVGPYPEAADRLSRALAEQLPGPLLGPGPDPPGPRRQGRAAIAGRGDRRGAGQEVDPVRVPRVRGRGSRVPRRVRACDGRSRRGSRSSARSSGSSRPTTFEPLEMPGLDAWLARHPRRVAVGAASGAGRMAAPSGDRRGVRRRLMELGLIEFGPIELVLGLFVVIVALAYLARRVGVAYPILLVLGGLVLGYAPGLPKIELEPDVVFLLLLPPILFGAAYSTPIRDFKANARPIALLAIGLVLFTTVVVGMRGLLLVPSMGLAPAFALGAIVAPPDAVAATSIFRRIGAPPRIVTILEGESLVNDASALIAYRFAVAAGGHRHLRRWPTPASRSSTSGSAGSWSGCWSASW